MLQNKNWTNNLLMIDKAKVSIENLLISEEKLEKLSKTHPVEVAKLKVEELNLFRLSNIDMNSKIIDILSEINPTTISINELYRSVK